MRRAAIGAATYPAWREFGPRVEILVVHDDVERVRDLAQDDPDQAVREMAEIAGNACRPAA